MAPNGEVHVMLFNSMMPFFARSELVEDCYDLPTGSIIGKNSWAYSASGSTNATFTVATDATATYGKSVRCTKTTSDAVRDILFLKVGTSIQNVEILVRSKLLDSINTGTTGSYVVLRQSADGAQGYWCAFAPGKLQLWRSDAAASGTMLGEVAYSPDVGSWYWRRIRANGSSIKVRVWEHGDAEPSTWQIEETEGTYTSGRVGMGTFETNNEYSFDVFAVGLNGNTAYTN